LNRVGKISTAYRKKGLPVVSDTAQSVPGRRHKIGCRSRLRDGHGFGSVAALAAWISQSLCAVSLSDRNSGYVLPWIGQRRRGLGWRAEARRGGNPRAGGGGKPPWGLRGGIAKTI